MKRSRKPAATIVGGGPKKILYTLQTLGRIGIGRSAKALNSRNTCKACGLGMGGQRGGMTNELGDFPAVCNKSIQAQSTDLQPAIPEELFAVHPLKDFQSLSDHELEHLGRLGSPLYKAADSDHYVAIPWEEAFDLTASRLASTIPSRTFFYASGRSSNEAGFILQLLARLYGTHNVNNCSYYCHQATTVGLYNTLGTGTATITLEDLTGADLVLLIGANPASNHPRFVHQLKACRDRGGQVIVVNPAREAGLVRFAVPKSATSMLSGGTWIASEYVQPCINGDLALLKGMAKALVEADAINRDFVDDHTENVAAFIEDLQNTDWDDISDGCGIGEHRIRQLAQAYASAGNAVIAWGMGITHHLNGVDNVEAIANLALLRGMIGKPSAGLLPLRGHSNVQGMGSMGVKPELAHDVLEHLRTHLGITLPSAPGLDTLACLNEAHAGRMDVALLMGGNLYAATPDSQWAQQALDAIGLKVFLTTTLNRGHVTGMESSAALLLPVTARDEEWQPTTQESMFNYVRLSDGGITRLTGVRPETHILCEIGRRLLPQGPVDFAALSSHDSIRAAIGACIPGFEPLTDINATKQEFTIAGRRLHTPGFHTPSGKARFCITPLPPRRTSDTFPWLLASIRSEGQFNSIIYEEDDSYRGTDTRWSVLMHQDDIDALGTQVGHTVDILSAQGCMSGVTVFAFDVPRGNVLAYYPEANVLTSTEHDPRSQTPAFKSVPVRIVPR